MQRKTHSMRNLSPLFILSLCSFAPFAQAQNARWDVTQVVANGNGCRMGENTAVIVADNQIQLIFLGMGIELPANSGLPLAQRKACTVSLAAELASGFYAKGIRQNLRFGGRKSAQASAALAAQSTFFGLPLKPLTVNLEAGTIFNELNAVVESEDTLVGNAADIQSRCAMDASRSGLLSSRMVAQGSRDNDSAELLLSAGNYDLKYSATLLWESCPQLNPTGLSGGGTAAGAAAE